MLHEQGWEEFVIWVDSIQICKKLKQKPSLPLGSYSRRVLHTLWPGASKGGDDFWFLSLLEEEWAFIEVANIGVLQQNLS